jgi:hypothetical protein
MGRHSDFMPFGDAEDTSVKELVMEAAEAQRVVDRVRPVEGPPTEVGSVETDRFGAEPTVVPAHGAPILVSDQHGLAERRVTPPQPLRAGEHR